MAVRRVSIALDEVAVADASSTAERRGVSLSVWLNAAAERTLILEEGLAQVRVWESEHGELTDDELAWADSILDRGSARGAS